MLFPEPVSFQEADDFLHSRQNTATHLKSREIAMMWDAEARQAAFFSARVTQAAIVSRLHDVCQSVLSGQMSRAQARRLLREYFLGEGADALAAMGFAPARRAQGIAQLASLPRLELIIYQNVKMAQERGHYQQWQKVRQDFPYGIWHVGNCANHREAHLARDGKIYAFDHPIWTQSPPGGEFNCHCYRELLSEKDMKERGLSPEPLDSEFEPSSLGFDPSRPLGEEPHFGRTTRREYANISRKQCEEEKPRVQAELEQRQQEQAKRVEAVSQAEAAAEQARKAEAARQAEAAEAARKAAEEAARKEAERIATEEAARQAEAARLEAERLSAEEAARQEQGRLAAEEAARQEAERISHEEAERMASKEVVKIAAETAEKTTKDAIRADKPTPNIEKETSLEIELSGIEHKIHSDKREISYFKRKILPVLEKARDRLLAKFNQIVARHGVGSSEAIKANEKYEQAQKQLDTAVQDNNDREEQIDKLEQERLEKRKEKNRLTQERINAIPLEGYNRIEGEHSREEDAAAVNPHFSTGERKYTNNCQRCVVAYEARRRGWDVEATEWLGGANDSIYWGKWKDVFKFAKLGATHASSIDEIKRYMGRVYGEGARAMVSVDWENGGAHLFFVEQINGETVFIDPQDPSRNALAHFSNAKMRNTVIYRVDNLEIDITLFRKCCKNRER